MNHQSSVFHPLLRAVTSGTVDNVPRIKKRSPHATEFGHRLRLARMYRGYGTNELDRRVGHESGGQTSKIESGLRQLIDIETAWRYATALDVSYLWLTKGFGRMEDANQGGSREEVELRHHLSRDNLRAAAERDRRLAIVEGIVRANAEATGTEIASRTVEQWFASLVEAFKVSASELASVSTPIAPVVVKKAAR